MIEEKVENIINLGLDEVQEEMDRLKVEIKNKQILLLIAVVVWIVSAIGIFTFNINMPIVLFILSAVGYVTGFVVADRAHLVIERNRANIKGILFHHRVMKKIADSVVEIEKNN
jgi:hypothetical protein